MNLMQPLPIADILAKIKVAEEISSDYALAKKLGVQSAHISTWRSRGTVPFERLLSYCFKTGVDIFELIYGKTNKQPSS